MRHVRWLVAWLACTLGAFSVFASPRTTPLHPDEVYWIGSTYYYHLAFERFDWTHADWKLQVARENPPVAKYVLGAGLALQGQHIVVRDMLGCFHLMFRESPGAWGEGDEYSKRVAVVGDMTPASCSRVQGGPGVSRPRALPYLARRVIIACTALTSLLIFVFGAAVANRATGLVASQLLLLHPDVVGAYNQAMSDPIAMMFSTAAAFAAWRFYQRMSAAETSRPREAVTLAAISGALLALACGAKMNSLIVAMLFGAAALWVALRQWWGGRPRQAMITLAYAGVGYLTALAVFVITNPAILFDLRDGLIAVVREPELNTAIQARSMPHLFLSAPLAKLLVVTGVTRGPLLFLLLVALGVVASVSARRVGMWFVTAWFAIAVVCVAAWIPFAWPRYVMPLMPPFVLLVAHALVRGGEVLRNRFGPAVRT